jgi:histidinol dehydrogenase
VVVFDNMEGVIQGANEFASEHLEVQCGTRSREIATRIVNAGAIFIGPYTPVAVGDYWAGPSHTLPTGTRARFSSRVDDSPLNQQHHRAHGRALPARRTTSAPGQTEGLDAHARSVRIRHG